MERRTPAIAILLIGLCFGIAGYHFLYRSAPGIGVVIFIGLLLISILGLTLVNRIALSLRKLWLIIPIVFFTGMIAVRANVDIVTLDGLMAIALLLLFAHFLTRDRALDTTSTLEQVFAGSEAGLMSGVGMLPTLAGVWGWMKDRNWRDMGGMKSVLRGIFFAVPVVIVFGILLSSADMVFAQRITSIFGFLLPENIDSILEMLFITGAITWVCTGFLYYSVLSRTQWWLSASNTEPSTDEVVEDDDNPKQKNTKATFISLNLTESGIVLTSVVVLFAVFVMIQFTYLFGGRTMIGDFTFSEYARRGFFELVAVSVLVQGLVLALDHSTIRRSAVQNSVFRVLSIVLIGETFAILTSAWRRMSLYEIEYGFTHLRLFTHIFMVWLAILMLFGILSLFRVKKNVFSLGLLVVAMGYLATLNILNVDNYIATHNIERYEQDYDLDMCYLRGLSPDAQPAIAAFYAETTDEAVLYHLRDLLRNWHSIESNRYADPTPMEFNVSHQRTQQYLEALDTIPLNISDWQSCYIDTDSSATR